MGTTRYYRALAADCIDTPPERCWKLDEETAPSYLVGPAFFDAQVNGYAGIDFQSPELTRDGLEHAVTQMHQAGCSHFLLTLITADAACLEAQLKRIAGFVESSPVIRETIPGFHLEGPFVSPEPGYVGAHPVEYVCPPDWTQFERWQQASGHRIRMVTLAPEWEGSTEFIRKAAASNVFVSLGHTDASREQLSAAAAAGARMFTHLGNACPQEMHRYDNIIHRVLSVPELMVSLIPDGLHIPPPALANVVRMLGPARVLMTTDGASPAGAPQGTYQLGGLELQVGEDRVVRPSNGSGYAGSALTPVEGFYNCIRFGGLSADLAWQAWTRLRTILFPDIKPPSLMLPFGRE